MHYERKRLNKTSLKTLIKNSTIPATLITIFILVLYIHAPFEFWWPIKFIDVINAIAQIATASAFFLAIHQYRKNRESERQKVLIEESRLLINRMRAEAESYSSLLKLTLKKSMSFMDNMINYAKNFDAIFRELNEDIHKAIVRMHWQDMYFGDLNKAIQKFNTSTDFTDFSAPSEANLYALVDAKHAENTSDNPSPSFLEYIRLQYISNSSHIKNEIKISDEDHLTMYLFEKLFFDNSALKDHLYGTFKYIDVRSYSPLLAVINERYTTQPTNRDRESFKMFWPLPAQSRSDSV